MNNTGFLVLVLFCALILAGLPGFNLHHHGYVPSGVGTVLLVLLVVALLKS